MNPSAAMLARAAKAQAGGAVIVLYAELERGLSEVLDPDAECWCFEMDFAFVEGDVEALMEAGRVTAHPDYGLPCLFFHG